jgi:nicotinate-nucleotide adenylyltransferase
LWFRRKIRSRQSNTLLHEQDRLHMVRLAIDDNPSLNATDIEFNMPRPSYTIDTLAYLHQRYPSYEFVP